MFTRRGKTLATVLSAFTFLMLFGTALFSSPAGCFRRNVLFPAPVSVSNIQVSANNQFFWIAPEPVVHIRFSASPDDMQTILTKRRGEPYDGFIPALNFGPTWFRPANSTNGLRQFPSTATVNFLDRRNRHQRVLLPIPNLKQGASIARSVAEAPLTSSRRRFGS